MDPNYDEDVQPYSSETQQTAIVFLLDVGDKMLEVSDDMTEEHLLLSLKMIREWLRNYIFRSVQCYASVLFLATKGDKQIGGKTIPFGNNVSTFISLNAVGAEMIKKIDSSINLIQQKAFRSHFEKGDFALADGLWMASLSLTETKRKLKKQIVLLTNEDCPFQSQKDQARGIARLSDLEKLKIDFSIIPFGSKFSPEKYQEILQVLQKDKSVITPVLNEQEALERCEKPKRRLVPLANIPLEVTENLSIPVTIHYLAKQVKLPSEKALDAETNAPVMKMSSSGPNSKADGAPLGKHNNVPVNACPSTYEIFYYEKVGQQTVMFTAEEEKLFNSIGEQKLRLLGFKPVSWLSLEYHIQPSGFMLASEKEALGATSLLVGLIERCKKKEVVAICTFCPRKSSLVRYVALLPVTTGDTTGFLVIYLPFAEEVRDLDEECTKSETASPELVQLMKQVVKKLSFQFDVNNFANPELATYWSAVEAQALGYEHAEPVDDPSLPDLDAQRTRLGELQDRLQEAFYGDNYRVPGPAEKKVPTTIDNIQNIKDVEDNYAEDTLGRLNLEKLKSYLKHIGRGEGLSKMKKNDIIERIKSILDKESTY